MKNKFILKASYLKILIMYFILFILFDFLLTKTSLFFGLNLINESIVFQNNIQNNRQLISSKHPVYHHDFKKLFQIDDEFNGRKYKIFTNSLGFKASGKNIVIKDSKNKRILFIGDSFTEGASLNYENTFPGIIEDKLKKKNISILNASRASYSPIIYWRKIKYLIEIEKLKFTDLVVAIDISDIEDEAKYYRLSKDGNVEDRSISKKTVLVSFMKKNFIATYSILNFFSDNLKKLIFKLRNNNKIFYTTSVDSNPWNKLLSLNFERDKWTIDKNIYFKYGEEGLKNAKHFMDLIHELSKKYNFKLTILVYPWPSQVWYEDLESLQVTYWKKWSNSKKNVKFIDLFPLFVKKNMTEKEKLEILNNYYISSDVHFNENGHRKIAEEILKNLNY